MEKGALSSASGAVKGRCAENSFVSLRLFKFKKKWFLRGTNWSAIEEATDLQMNGYKIAEFRLWWIVNHTDYITNQPDGFSQSMVWLWMEGYLSFVFL